MRMRAIERGIEIISEASRKLPPDFKATHPEIPWREIAGIGNILRHDYGQVDAGIISNIIDEHLEPLNKLVESEVERREGLSRS